MTFPRVPIVHRVHMGIHILPALLANGFWALQLIIDRRAQYGTVNSAEGNLSQPDHSPKRTFWMLGCRVFRSDEGGTKDEKRLDARIAGGR